MIDLTVSTDIEVPEWSFSLTPDEWRHVGDSAIDSIKQRLARGIGANGSPMPPLSPRYATQKRRFGGSGIRDLRGDGRNGHMLEAITARATSDGVEIALAGQLQLQKASANDTIAPWFGLAEQDQKTVGDLVYHYLTGEVGRAA